MKCAVLHAFPPHRYNLQAPTATPYQLLKHAPDDLDIDLFYFAGEEKHRRSSEACIKPLRLTSSQEIPRPAGVGRFYRLAMARLRGLPGSVGMFPPSKTIVQRINSLRPDIIWLYPHWLIDWVPRLECENIVVTGPDSAVLHNERALEFGDLDQKETKRQRALMKRNTKLERLWGSSQARMHMVGKADVDRYNRLNEGGGLAFFVRHPVYDHSTVGQALSKKAGKITVMFSGGGQTVFAGSHLRRAIESIAHLKGLSDQVELSFLGNGYSAYASRLRDAGFYCTVRTWADDYEAELATAQVHVFPIAVGTGTNGTILTAIATGSLCIGSAVAFENIAVTPGEDCVKYNRPDDIGAILAEVLGRRETYARIAESGAKRVAEEYDPAKVAKAFWDRAIRL